MEQALAAARRAEDERRHYEAQAQGAAMALAGPERTLSGVTTIDSIAIANSHVVELDGDFTSAITLAVHATFGGVTFVDDLDGWENRLYIRLSDKLTAEQGLCWMPEQWPKYVGGGQNGRQMIRISQPVGAIVNVHLLPRCCVRNEGAWEGLNRNDNARVQLADAQISWLARCIGS